MLSQTPFFESYPGKACMLSLQLSLEVMPAKSLYPSILTRKLRRGNPCTLLHSPGSYAGKARTLSSLLTQKLCRKIPVHFHAHLKLMPENPCTLSHNSFRELCGQSLYALTKI